MANYHSPTDPNSRYTYWQRINMAEGRLWDFAASQLGVAGHLVRAKAFELADRYHEHMQVSKGEWEGYR